MATGRIPTTANSPLTVKGDLFGYSTTQARVPVGNDGETLVADSSTSTGLNYKPLDAAGKNALINGGMDIWQRGTSATTNVYLADRWITFGNTPNRTSSRQTASLDGFTWALRTQRNSGSTSTGQQYAIQTLESINSIPFQGKTVVLSWYAKAGANYSSASSALTFSVESGTGTDQSYISGFTGAATVVSGTKTLTTSWQRFTATGTVSASATQLNVQFNYTPVGTAGANDWFDITGVQLELGSTATTFSRAGGTIQGELAACQRYYYRTNAVQLYEIFGAGTATNTTTGNATVRLPVTMRINPSAVEYSTLNFAPFGAVGGGAVTALTLASGGNSNNTPTLAITNSGNTIGQYYSLYANNSTSAYIGLSAEL